MLIQFASDLHLEIAANREFVAAGAFKPAGDVLVLAGDIALLSNPQAADFFWDWCSRHFARTWIVPGNHEFYGESGNLLGQAPLRVDLRENVSYCNNASIDVEEVTLVFSTLFSRISDPLQRSAIERQIADYRAIFCRGRPITVDQVNAFHEKARSFILRELCRCEKRKTVVVTHYVPAAVAAGKRYACSDVREAFVADCSDIIAQGAPHVWIHGHSHSSGKYMLGRTRILSNQLGTVRPAKKLDFDPSAVIEI